MGRKKKQPEFTPEELEANRAFTLMVLQKIHEREQARPKTEPPELTDREESDRILSTFDRYDY